MPTHTKLDVEMATYTNSKDRTATLGKLGQILPYVVICFFNGSQTHTKRFESVCDASDYAIDHITL